MALCMVSFNQVVGRRLPQLLLMDEIDSMLHPSMVKALIRTLKTSLRIEWHTGVDDFPFSHDSGHPRRRRRSSELAERVTTSKYRRSLKAKQSAKLSEGLATVDMGLKIAAYGESRINCPNGR